jgi:hypothetical protein
MILGILDGGKLVGVTWLVVGFLLSFSLFSYYVPAEANLAQGTDGIDSGFPGLKIED